MKKVLIIAYNFPPMNNVASRRFGDLTYYMKEFGWDPYILTTNSQGNLPVRIEEDKIIRVGQHFQQGIGFHQPSTKKKNPIKRLIQSIYHRLGFRLRVIDKFLFSWGKDIKQKQDEIIEKTGEVDLVLSSFGPGSSIWLGKYFSKKLNVPWILDYRDMASLYTDGRNNLVISGEKSLEKRLIKDAKVLTTIGNTLNEVLKKNFKKKTYTVFNGWDQGQSIDVEQDLDSNFKNNKYIYYAGRFYQHQMRSTEMVLEALAKIDDIKFIIRSLGPTEFDQHIRSYAEQLGIEDRIIFLPPSDPDTVLNEARSAYVNLVVEDLDMEKEWKKGTLTGKFLSLLPLPAPILTVARPDSEIGEILDETNKGLLCSNTNDVLQFLNQISLNENIYNGNKAKIASFSKEEQAKKLCQIFDEVVESNVK